MIVGKLGSFAVLGFETQSYLPIGEGGMFYDQHVLTTDCTKALISPSRFWSIS